jgi:hypothetical protein
MTFLATASGLMMDRVRSIAMVILGMLFKTKMAWKPGNPAF